ncbi:aldehyde dehydrogenase (NADP(+)) [Sinorhizobium saheli]|uniref:2,5-dioxovalerate dehydrogenase n=1 Tax=Sinorhizobium saheli TaxID=36856 RepID=A0A178Y7P0_SINSA|nr:aldehyde dehydrogenase (NADP(+)) [Sinorhizobium saheli]MQW87884.1 aldehyde dehydrogenase family protein [Sinorhizobium saheli]OAP43083.1 2,5-dioxovalerate dehydrogenase [Sinorhizobium saheli]
MITGELLIGGSTRRGSDGEIWGIEAASGRRLEPSFGGAALEDLEQACLIADQAFDTFRRTSPEERAMLLEKIGSNILDLGDELIDRCVAETGLPRIRIEGERSRTVGQLQLFASVVREGAFLDVRIDKAMPSRKPQPRADLRLTNIGVGPVGVFGASNFPLAFSVAGGDTASALAAGCPVIVKAHSAHPGTSELVGRAVQSAVRACELPEGTFSLIFDSKRAVSQALVANPRIKAIGFTGSRGAGVAFMQIAARRPEPIPVYAEMSSINPVILFPSALAARGAEIGSQLVAALTLGAGQFCTNPGLILAVNSEGYDSFVTAAREAISATTAATMLTPAIHKAYRSGVDQLVSHQSVTTVARGRAGGENQAQAGIFETTAGAFLSHRELQDEVFGAATLIVRCDDAKELREVVEHLEGQLTIALHIDQGDYMFARELTPLLERKAGRLIVNGFGTGVEVSHAMVHGGPFPATSDVRTTSVGSLAIERFLRPVCYQAFPPELLPCAVSDANAWGVPQRTDPGT